LGRAGTYALLVAAALRRSVLRAADEKEEESVSIFWIVFFAAFVSKRDLCRPHRIGPLALAPNRI
jgi:hypothetical protein